jgi:hypothetical protein
MKDNEGYVASVYLKYAVLMCGTMKPRRWHVLFFSSVPLVYSYTGDEVLLSFFLIISQTVGLLGRVIGPSQGRYLNTGQHKHRKTHTYTKHPCPEWNSNPRSRQPSEQRQCMPKTARLPWPAVCTIPMLNCASWLFSGDVSSEADILRRTIWDRVK